LIPGWPVSITGAILRLTRFPVDSPPSHSRQYFGNVVRTSSLVPRTPSCRLAVIAPQRRCAPRARAFRRRLAVIRLRIRSAPCGQQQFHNGAVSVARRHLSARTLALPGVRVRPSSSSIFAISTSSRHGRVQSRSLGDFAPPSSHPRHSSARTPQSRRCPKMRPIPMDKPSAANAIDQSPVAAN